MDKRTAIDILKGEGFLHLSAIENTLRTETSCVAPEDVPLLMKVLYEKADVAFPKELQDEIDQNVCERGDCGEDCTVCAPLDETPDTLDDDEEDDA